MKKIIFVLSLILLTACKSSYYNYQMQADVIQFTYKVVACYPVNVYEKNPLHKYCIHVTDGSGNQYRVFVNKEYPIGSFYVLNVKNL